MLRNVLFRIIRFAQRNVVIILTLFLFSLIWDVAILEESASSKWGLGGAAGGAAAGGLTGWAIGGIGIAAMGTGVGIPALAVIGLGALLGGAAGGSAGNLAGSIYGAYESIDFEVLLWVFFATLGLSVFIIHVVSSVYRVFLWLRRRSSGPERAADRASDV